MSKSRFPRSVYGQGADPDPRFSLANERTFLSWIRTSLAFIAGALALEALDIPLQPTFRLLATIVFLVLGLATPVYAWVNWARNERALRTGKPLTGPSIGLVLSAALTVIVVLLGVGLLLAGLGGATAAGT